MFPEKRAEEFFKHFKHLLPALALLAQTTTTTTSNPMSDFVSWFASTFISVLVPMFVFIALLMFFYAVVRAPLDVLRKTSAVSLLALLVGSVEFYVEAFKTFWSLLFAVLFILLPLILILVLYKSFMALVRAK